MLFSAKFLANLSPSPRKLKRLAVITPDIFLDVKADDKCSGLPAPPMTKIGLFILPLTLSKIDYQISNYIEGKYAKILQMANISKDQLYWFTLPSKKDFLEKNIKLTHWSFYENWDPYRNYEIAKEYCGLEENKTLNEGTYTNFGQMDQKLYALHVYLMYLKYGFGRATMDAGVDVRRGAMTREQAINLVKMFDNQAPESLYDEYCEYFKMTKNNFLDVIDKFANKSLFEKKNRWEPKFEIK